MNRATVYNSEKAWKIHGIVSKVLRKFSSQDILQMARPSHSNLKPSSLVYAKKKLRASQLQSNIDQIVTVRLQVYHNLSERRDRSICRGAIDRGFNPLSHRRSRRSSIISSRILARISIFSSFSFSFSFFFFFFFFLCVKK